MKILLRLAKTFSQIEKLFPVVHYFVWELELDSNILWMIAFFVC